MPAPAQVEIDIPPAVPGVAVGATISRALSAARRLTNPHARAIALSDLAEIRAASSGGNSDSWAATAA